MSMHKKPLTELERSGLEAHGLPIGTASQCSDSFRNGMAWINSELESANKRIASLVREVEEDRYTINNLKHENECLRLSLRTGF